MQWYHANIDTGKTFWAVGENFRYVTKFLYTAQQVRKMGKVRHFRVDVHNMVTPDNKYYSMCETPTDSAMTVLLTDEQ